MGMPSPLLGFCGLTANHELSKVGQILGIYAGRRGEADMVRHARVTPGRGRDRQWAHKVQYIKTTRWKQIEMSSRPVRYAQRTISEAPLAPKRISGISLVSRLTTSFPIDRPIAHAGRTSSLPAPSFGLFRIGNNAAERPFCRRRRCPASLFGGEEASLFMKSR
jgi:hypothetical protein